MTRILKHAVMAGMAAAFAIALASPGQAQQDNMQRHEAANQHVYTPYDTASDRDMAVEGYRAYAYAQGAGNVTNCSQSPASPNYVPCLNQ
jgi:hypothetical protein